MHIAAVHAAGHENEEYQRCRQDDGQSEITGIAGFQRQATQGKDRRDEGKQQRIAQQEGAHRGRGERNQQHGRLVETEIDFAARVAILKNKGGPAEADDDLDGEEAAAPVVHLVGGDVLGFCLTRQENADGIDAQGGHAPCDNIQLLRQIDTNGGHQNDEQRHGDGALQHRIDMKPEHFPVEAGRIGRACLQAFAGRAHGFRHSRIAVAARFIDDILVCRGADALTHDLIRVNGIR